MPGLHTSSILASPCSEAATWRSRWQPKLAHRTATFFQGITTEVLNPKTALFFLSFIPQFVMPARGHLISQFLLLGATSVSLNTAADMIVVALAGAVAHKLKNNPNFTRRQRTASGLGMIGLGTYVAVSK